YRPDYHQRITGIAPTAAMNNPDSITNPDYLPATTAACNNNNDISEGYSKSVTIGGILGCEAFQNESKHATLWVMVANRYFLQIELQNRDPKELQEWVKRVDLKKLGEIK